MGSAAILVVNSFESNSGEGEVSHSQKTRLLCFRLKRKAFYFAYDPLHGGETEGVPWLS